ncbi:hypothetical protein BLOT_003608 [Blomia tropicalis]|nr:hypothetical protein BLOT_003608 [Blomia tropicalis]
MKRDQSPTGSLSSIAAKAHMSNDNQCKDGNQSVHDQELQSNNEAQSDLDITRIDPPSQFQSDNTSFSRSSTPVRNVRSSPIVASNISDRLLTPFELNDSNRTGSIGPLSIYDDTHTEQDVRSNRFIDYIYSRSHQRAQYHRSHIADSSSIQLDYHSLRTNGNVSDSTELQSISESEPPLRLTSYNSNNNSPINNLNSNREHKPISIGRPIHLPPVNSFGYETDNSIGSARNSISSDHHHHHPHSSSSICGVDIRSCGSNYVEHDRNDHYQHHHHHHQQVLKPYYYGAPPPPPPTVISENVTPTQLYPIVPNLLSNGNNANIHLSTATPHMLYMNHQMNLVDQLNDQLHISNGTSPYQSLTPPVLSSPSSTTVWYCHTDPNTFINDIARTQSPPNIITVYNQLTGQTRSFCSNGLVGDELVGSSVNGKLPHHHHHHHLYHCHSSPSSKVNKLIETTMDRSHVTDHSLLANNMRKKAPLYATLNPHSNQIQSSISVHNGPDCGSNSDNNNNNDVANGKQSKLRLSGTSAGVYAGPSNSSQMVESLQHHLNGNCIANHDKQQQQQHKDQQHQQHENQQYNHRTRMNERTNGNVMATSGSLSTQHVQRGLNDQSADVEAELTRKAAEQEAQLRELKGYEASYQYQPQSSLLMSDPLKYGAISGPRPPLANTNAIPGADKRSCSEWRMTLFVFYWIIWIVFLIGVVIIVAANARTA